jgi:hypothetical protein
VVSGTASGPNPSKRRKTNVDGFPCITHAVMRMPAVKHLGKYLIAFQDQEIILNPKDYLFDCWVDTNFVGIWDRVNADVHPSTAKSRMGSVISYGGCPIS